jgi:3-phenylpropionate/trans-cinnamate dioxygenase ferredoxin reductase component
VSGVVIIGAGHAGGSAAGFLRQYGYDGPITLIGDEAYPPYQRPPLSKAWLKGEADLDDLFLKGDDFYSSHNIDLRLSTRVSAIRPDQNGIELADGTRLTYEHLIIATGTRLRPLPYDGADSVPYHQVYQLDQARAVAAKLKPGARIGIIGTGYIGLEVAASARKLGCDVTVIGRGGRLLRRVASEALAAAFQAIHEDNGVSFLLQSETQSLSSHSDGSQMIALKDGTVINVDTIIAGIGAMPNNALARTAGLKGHSDIVVDHEARTSVANIFAIGDVTSRPLSPHYDGLHHLESVPSALEQAKQAAAAITGYKPPAVEVPWFWSDQYAYKLQIAGLIEPDTRAVVRGTREHGGFSVMHIDSHNRLRFAECVNRPADFMAAKLLIAKVVALEESVLKDPEASLKPYLRP